MLTLVEEDRSALLWEKAYGKAALQHSVGFFPRVAVCSCNTCKHTNTHVLMSYMGNTIKGVFSGEFSCVSV